MADNAVAFTIKLDAQFQEAAQLAAALKSAEANLHSVDTATKHAEGSIRGADDELKLLRQTLADLKKPQEIERLKDEIAHFGKESKDAHEKGGHSAKEHEEEWEGLGGEIEHAYGSLHQFLYFTGALAAYEVVEKLVDGIKELGAEILHAAAAEERIGKSFELNLGAKGGREAIEYAEKFAKSTEFIDDQAKDFTSSLVQAGVGLEDLPKFMAAAGDVAARSKNPVEGMAEAIEALSRAQLSGNLDGRSLRRLHIGIPQLQGLAEFKNATDAQMKALLSDGAITKDQLFRAIAGPDNVLGDAAVEMSKTMGAKLNKLRNLPEQYYEKFSTSKGYDSLKGKVGEILESLDPDGPRGARIFASLERSAESVVGVIAGIDFEKVASEIETEIVPGIESLVTEAAKIDWVGGAKELYSNLKDAKDIVVQIGHILGVAKDAAIIVTEMTNPFEMLKGGVHHFLNPEEAIQDDIAGRGPIGRMLKAGGRLLDAAESVDETPATQDTSPGDVPNQRIPSDYVSLAQPVVPSVTTPEAEAALNAAKAAWALEHGVDKAKLAGLNTSLGYAGGIRDGLPEVAAAGGELAEGALDATNKKQESQSPSRAFRRAGRYGGEGYALGFGDAEDLAELAGRDVAVAAMAGAGGVGEDRVGMPLGFDPDLIAAATSVGQRLPSVDEGDGVTTAAPPAGPGPMVGQPGRPIEVTVHFHLGDVRGGRGGAQADELLDKLRAAAPGVIQGIVEQLAIEAGV